MNDDAPFRSYSLLTGLVSIPVWVTVGLFSTSTLLIQFTAMALAATCSGLVLHLMRQTIGLRNAELSMFVFLTIACMALFQTLSTQVGFDPYRMPVFFCLSLIPHSIVYLYFRRFDTTD